jgi:mannosyltransferase
VPDATDSAARWVRPAAIAALIAGIVLRFVSTSPLWLDESQTVAIAHRSIPHLFSALRIDGSPPLFYLLLHGWMKVFGTSDFGVRSLSSLLSVAALPLMAVVARRYRIVDGAAWPAVLLLATNPFAIRYATEARMYSLVLFLMLVALIAYEKVWRDGGLWPILGAGLVTGALMLTQYWALFMVAATGLGILIAVRRGISKAARLLIPLAIGCLVFIPWVPTFLYQSKHTGAPWGSPPGILVPILSVGGWVGSGVAAPILLWSLYILIAAAIAGYPGSIGGLTFRRPLRRRPLLVAAISVGTLLLATLASEVSSSAFAPRYTMIVFPLMLLVAAGGFAVWPARTRPAAIAVVCGAGLVASMFLPTNLRTQAAQVAKVLEQAGPDDLVVFCPDQLGPAVNRLAPHAGRQVVYPTFGSSTIVNWVDYKHRNEHAHPVQFAREALKRANGHRIWLVYEVGYPTLQGGCSSLLTSFTLARGRPDTVLKPHAAFERDTVAMFQARPNLTAGGTS